MQHHGNSRGLLCIGLYHQAWGSMVFSSSVAGFLGQPATQGCYTAYWANISLEGSYEGIGSLRRATALRSLGGQSKKGGVVFQETRSICLASHTEYMDGKLAIRETRTLSSHKPSTTSCSSPKSDTRPPSKLFISVSSLSKNQSQHESSKCPLSPVPPDFLTTKLHLLFLTVWLPAALKPIPQLWNSQSSCSPVLLPYW